jgi:hypothetical protein
MVINHILGDSDKSGILFFFLLNDTRKRKIIQFYLCKPNLQRYILRIILFIKTAVSSNNSLDLGPQALAGLCHVPVE